MYVCGPGADVLTIDDTGEQQFRYPSYVQHIMGDIFSLGFGPFRSLYRATLYCRQVRYSARPSASLTLICLKSSKLRNLSY